MAVCPNGWVFVYELSGCGFESSCSHLNNYTDRKIMKVLTKRTEANVKKFGLVLFFIEDKLKNIRNNVDQ